MIKLDRINHILNGIFHRGKNKQENNEISVMWYKASIKQWFCNFVNCCDKKTGSISYNPCVAI